MKIECIFAMSSPKTSTYRETSHRAFLCPEIGDISSQIYGLLLPYGTPVRSLYGAVFGETGGSSLSCYIYSNSFPIMPKTETVCVGAKYSNTNARRSSARTASRVSGNQGTDKSSEQLLIELAEAFEAEKNAKNTAYYFILSNGLLDQFSDFCKNYRSRDPHKDCVEYLLSKC